MIGRGKLSLLLALGGLLLAGRAARRRKRTLDLRGRTVLLTGGSRGLGLVMARELVAAGARLAIWARDPAELERARRDLADRGGPVLALTCDVTDREQVAALVRRVRAELGPIDVLINNAGVIEVGPVEVMGDEDYEEAMRTHFWAPLHAIREVLPGMKARRAGRIVNISSVGGKVSVPHLVPYSASKFALVGLSEGLRAELMKDGILVTTVCPGLMRTGSPRNAIFKGRHRAEHAWFSILDSLPVTSMDARQAARRIIEALRYGEAEVVLSTPAKLAVLFHGLLPGVTAELLGLLNGLLPGPGGLGTRRARGWQSQSWLSPSWLTALSDQAAAENNEIEAGPP
jgi:NAD(P)-dependent dehydrogenase (short-subunit alcohol dehydrogenase family)